MKLPCILPVLSIAVFRLASARGVAQHHALPRPTAPRMTANTSDPFAPREAFFDQLLDHSNPSLGTFKQRYWTWTPHYAGPGSPISMWNGGETDAAIVASFFNTGLLTELYVEQIGGAGILLEHRYYGASSPYEKLGIQELQHLNLYNNMQDNIYFAQNVRPDFVDDSDDGSGFSPEHVPWILSGGSYSAGLAAWISRLYPGVFWAYYVSSAVVEAVAEYTGYYETVRDSMPRNCSADVQRVIAHVDAILQDGSEDEKYALKERFGLQGVEYDDDFGWALSGGPLLWQEKTFFVGYDRFDLFCDYVESGANASIPGPEGVGLGVAIEGYSKWTREVMIPGACESYGFWSGELNVDCWDSHNASSPRYTDRRVNNIWNIQYVWMQCNEPLKWFHTAAIDGDLTILSRLIDASWWENQCALSFPPEEGVNLTYGIARGLDVDAVNAVTGGWEQPALVPGEEQERVVWVSGEADPWRDVSMTSKRRPGGPLQSTARQPVFIVPGGYHGSELPLRNAWVNEGVAEVVEQVVRTLVGWVDEFYEERGNGR